LVEGGRAAGVVTADGERYVARHAVVASTNADQLYFRLLADEAPPALCAPAWRYRYGRGCLQIQLAPRWPDERFARIGQLHLTTALDGCTLAVAQGMAGLLRPNRRSQWTVRPRSIPAGPPTAARSCASSCSNCPAARPGTRPV
jgi:phytoene dehydrogenase-like protein